MAQWVPIGTVKAQGKESRVYRDEEGGGFSHSARHLPVTAEKLVALDERGFLAWDADLLRQQVLEAAGRLPAPERRASAPKPAFRERLASPRTAWAVTGLSLLLSVAVLIAAALAGSAPAASESLSGDTAVAATRAYLRDVDAVVRDRDTEAYAGLVDISRIGSILETATLQAYGTLPGVTATAAGKSAIREAYAGYRKQVLDAVAAGGGSGIPLYGISGGDYAAAGTTVTVTLVPTPAEEASVTTAPTANAGRVAYLFRVAGDGKVRLLRIDGLVPYLTSTALYMTRTGATP